MSVERSSDVTVASDDLRRWHNYKLAQYAWSFQFDMSQVSGQYTEFGNIDTQLPFLDDDEVAELVAIQPLNHNIYLDGTTAEDGYILADDELTVFDLQDNQQTEYGSFDTNTGGTSIVDNQTEASVVTGIDSLWRSLKTVRTNYEDNTNGTGGGGYVQGSGTPTGHMLNFRKELGRGPILDKDNTLQFGGQHVFSSSVTSTNGSIELLGSFNMYFDVFQTESARYRDIKA